jgi:vacuolar-type H+-ATPase subunit B/Vma2
VTTGKVVNVGTIERVSRFLDEIGPTDGVASLLAKQPIHEAMLFSADLSQEDMQGLVATAAKSKAFAGSGLSDNELLLRGARKAEKATRHKMNPNIPALGTREELTKAGILSDNFTDYGI